MSTPPAVARLNDVTEKRPISGGQVAAIQEDLRRLREAVSRYIYGKPVAIRHLTTTLIAGGHLLIEDVPGVGLVGLPVGNPGVDEGVETRCEPPDGQDVRVG